MVHYHTYRGGQESSGGVLDSYHTHPSKGFITGMAPPVCSCVRVSCDACVNLLPLLFMEGRLGERAGGESSSELATVLMASWYKGVELGMANLDMRDIMIESGF